LLRASKVPPLGEGKNRARTASSHRAQTRNIVERNKISKWNCRGISKFSKKGGGKKKTIMVLKGKWPTHGMKPAGTQGKVKNKYEKSV